MAEDLEGFNPLDSLGPEYGGINRPNINEISMSPFEGDRINQPQIDFPSFSIPYPSLHNPNINVRKQVVTKPKTSGKLDFEAQKKGYSAYLRAVGQANQSKNEYSKIYSYNAGPDGNNFYKRYMAYGQETFDKIGFSPLRDNEANFNEYTTNWQGAKAMLTQSFLPMVAKGFISGPRDMLKMLSGDFSGTNLEDAREYEELAAIGYSSKGGLTGFFNNAAMNFGYTAGIVLEAIAEEVAFLGIEAATAGGATPLVAAGTAKNIDKIWKGIKGLDFAKDFAKSLKGTLKGLANPNSARKFWEGVRSSENLARFGRFINPLENTFDAVQNVRKLKNLDNITSLAAISKTAGGFYRDIRTINMATSEARLEAGMNENKVYDILYNEHYNRFGEPPSNEEQRNIIKRAKESSVDTFYKNAGLIYMSNKLTFGNVTSPRGGLRNFINSTKDDIVSIGNGKFGNIGKIVYNNAKKSFQFEANTFKNLAKSWYTDFGAKTALKTVGYFKANFVEGLQENAQEIISRANERYYTETYNSPLIKSHNFSRSAANYAAKSKSDYYLEELDNEVSMQGLETFASGFMMGMFAAPLNNAVPFISKNYNRIFNPQGYQEYIDNKTKIAEGLVKSLNDVNIGEFLKSRFFNTGSQDIINYIRQTGSKKQGLDAELESLVNATDLMLETNTTDVFVEKLRDIQQMDDKEFADAINVNENDDLTKYRNRIDTSISKMEKIQKKYKYYNEKFPSPVDSNMLENLDEKSDKYKDLVSLQKAWQASVRNAVFFNESFEDTITRMAQITDKFTSVTGLKKVGAADFQTILRPETIGSELALLKNEIDALSSIEDKTDQDKANLRAKKEKRKKLESFLSGYSKFNLFFNRNEYYDQVKESLTEQLGAEPTEEEINKVLEESLGDINNEDLKRQVVEDLKIAFDEYVSTLAEANSEFAFNENLDQAFELLMDHYKLSQESKKMAMYVNILHDPGNFFDLVQRNKKWMRELYERRTEYYENIIKQELDGVEDNALLNKLASQGLYLSLEEFAAWKYDGTPPKEFFDGVNKKVIPQGTEEYNKAWSFFQMAAALKEKEINIADEILSSDLKLQLERLEKEKQSRMDSLPDVPIKKNEVQIKKPRFKSMNYKYLSDQMSNDSYADIVVETKEGKEEITVFKDSNGILRRGDSLGPEIDLKEKGKIRKAQQYNIIYEQDPKVIDDINREFIIRKNELIKSSRIKNKEPYYTRGESAVDKDTALRNMPVELFTNLFNAFEEMVASDPVANKDLIDDVNKFNEALENFVKTDPEAQKIIDAYNLNFKTEQPLPDERAELITPKTLEEVEKALEALYTKNLVVNPENNDTYIEVDDQGMRIPGTPTYPRVSTRKPGERKFTNKAAANRGTIIDDMLRDFVEGKITSVDDMTNLYESHYLRNATEDFSPDFINDLFNIFTEVKDVVDKKGIKLISRIPTLWGVIDGKTYAGTIDLMGIDGKGNVYVIDLKTSSQNRRDEEGEYYNTFKEGDTEQQSSYAEMIRQRTGITVKNIVIFPVQTTVVKEFNQYTKAEAIKDENGKFTMQVEIDRNIFPETPTAEEEKVETPEPGISVGKELSPTAKAKLSKLGFTEEIIARMSSEDIETAKTFSSKEDAKELLDKYAKAETPTPTETIEAKKAERRKRYYNGPANRMVQVQKGSESTPVTQEQIEEIEQVIEKAKELGWDKNRLFRQLSNMGYSYAFGVNSEGYRNYLEDRLSGKTNIKVTSEYNFFQQLDAELDALETPVSNQVEIDKLNAEKKEKLDQVVRNQGLSGKNGKITTKAQAEEQNIVTSVMQEEFDKIDAEYNAKIAALKDVSKPTETQLVSSIKPEDLKINVSATTINGVEDILNQDNSIEDIREGRFASLTNTKSNSENDSGYFIEDGILRVRVKGVDRFGRQGGGTQVTVKVPVGFNETIFADKIKDIKHKGSVTTDAAIDKVVNEIRQAISESSLISKPISATETIKDKKADIERRRQEAKNSIKLRSKLEQALLKDKEEIERTGKVDNRASSALRQMIKNEEDKIDKEYDNIILKELGEIEYKKTKILRDKKNLEEYFSKSPTEDYVELENRKKRLAKYDEELTALEGEAPGVTEEVRDRRNRLSNNLIGIVWERLAKEGITNADPIIGTRATITNTDFDKFWSNVKTEDLQKLKKTFEEQKIAELAKVEELGEGAFDPKTGTLTDTASNIESYYNNLISDVSSELNETETKTPESASEFSKGARLIAKNDVFYKDKAGNNSIFAEAQSTVVVTKVDEKTGKVTVTPLGNSNSMEYTLEDINSNFEKESTVIQKTQEPQEEIVITDDDKQIIKESTDSIDTFLGETAAQAEIEKAVDDPKVTLKKLDEDLLDDLKC